MSDAVDTSAHELHARLLADSIARDRVIEDLESKPIRMTQVSGSSAGAGSGDFHHYRQHRRIEFARLNAINRQHRAEKEAEEFAKKRKINEEVCAQLTSKKSSKRQKKKASARMKKDNMRAAQLSEKAAANGADVEDECETGPSLPPCLRTEDVAIIRNLSNTSP
uniref:Uncharacterized protein n=1 Tax=Spongospora subterranea TaxID=70186 RepID=A0A0H5REG4_9EUKA|eukprot:CRZ11445.1 hypothetical protein [Spongospora subterranea]